MHQQYLKSKAKEEGEISKELTSQNQKVQDDLMKLVILVTIRTLAEIETEIVTEINVKNDY
jgi:hypothetical protein